MTLLATFSIFLSEFLTTTFLVICTCLASSVQGSVTDSMNAVALSAGLIQLVLMNCFGQISGAHGNPALSFALWCHGSMKIRRLVVYVVAQVAGAATGHWGVKYLLDKPADDPFCIPKMASISDVNLMGREFLLTFLLAMAWCAIWDYENLPLELYLAITNALVAVMAVVFEGTSTNPAITAAPAFFTGKVSKLHFYMISQFSAAFAAPLLLRKLREWTRG